MRAEVHLRELVVPVEKFCSCSVGGVDHTHRAPSSIIMEESAYIKKMASFEVKWLNLLNVFSPGMNVLILCFNLICPRLIKIEKTINVNIYV